MTERAADFEWRGEGEEAQNLLYAPGPAVAEASLERALSAARLPGVVSPVYVAASGTPSNFGWVAASETHAAPDLVSAPEWGLLIVAECRGGRGAQARRVRRFVGCRGGAHRGRGPAFPGRVGQRRRRFEPASALRGDPGLDEAGGYTRFAGGGDPGF